MIMATGLTIPVPKYPGLPLDPPLRSRFQGKVCLFAMESPSDFIHIHIRLVLVLILIRISIGIVFVFVFVCIYIALVLYL